MIRSHFHYYRLEDVIALYKNNTIRSLPLAKYIQYIFVGGSAVVTIVVLFSAVIVGTTYGVI